MSNNHNTGWINNADFIGEVLASLPNNGAFSSNAQNIVGTGAGKVVLLYDSFKKIGTQFHVINQGSVGSCVGCATAGAVDALKATEIMLGDREDFINYTAVAPIYGGGRVTIGKGKLRGDGLVVGWAMQYINKYGTVARGKYGNLDLSSYSASRCKTWGTTSGFPKTIEQYSKEHIVLKYAQCSNYEEVRDSLSNGYPVVFGSQLGFTNKRDQDGFAKVSGGWSHSQYFVAVDDDYKRKGALIQNSWGTWNSGPKRHEQPDGSYWVDVDVVNKICKGECYALSGFEGYKKKSINTRVM